jgi:hypothetical protein
VCEGFTKLELLPSPKLQLKTVPVALAPVEVLVKLAVNAEVVAMKLAAQVVALPQ